MCNSDSGTEWQYWLLFYSLPSLIGILPTTYYIHYCTLVCGIAILLGNNISQQDLHKAQILLNEFCQHTGDLYGWLIIFKLSILNYTTIFAPLIGFRGQTMNVHLLRHLVLQVRNWGPLWSYSCFPFESVNGVIRKLFHGTRDMSEQVKFNVSCNTNVGCNCVPFHRWYSVSQLCKAYRMQGTCSHHLDKQYYKE